MTELRTRRPTGKPSWPILLLAGAEKAGKSYSAAQATGSDLISRAYWVTIGEDEPDEYGLLGRFEIVEHDGTYRGILAALRAVAADAKGKPGTSLLVVDSMTRLWDQIKGHAQDEAIARAERNAKKYNRAAPDGEVPVSMDLWNAAADQWQAAMDAVRAFPGPAILTARLDTVAVVGDDGKPVAGRTTTKVQAHKSLPFDVGAVFEMPARGETWLTGVRSVRLQLPERQRQPKGWTVDGFWRSLGLAEAETSPRDHKAPERPAAAAPAPAQITGHENPVDVADLWRDRIRKIETIEQGAALHGAAKAQGILGYVTSEGDPVAVLFRRRADEIRAAAAQAEPDYEQPPAVPEPAPPAPPASPVQEQTPELVPAGGAAPFGADEETPF